MTIAVLERLASRKAGSAANGAGKVRSRVLDVDAPAGVYVVENSADRCDLPTTAAEVTGGRGGFLRYDPSRAPNANGLEWAANEQVSFFKRGPMVVLTEEAVTANDPVFVRFAAKGANTQLGACRNDADGDPAETLELTNTITTDSQEISVTLDGITFDVATGTSESANDKAVLIQAAIDAHADYTATAPGAGVVSVTRGDGAQIIVGPLEDGVTAAYAADSDPETCAALPGAYFVDTVSAAGAALIDFDLP